MWWTSACPGVGRHSGCGNALYIADGIRASRGRGAIEKGGMMQSFSIPRTTVCQCKGGDQMRKSNR